METPPNRDPSPYDGPISRADGRRPYNRYLWPLDEDWFWANREFGHRIHSCWNFSVVALSDGRYAVDGFVWCIEDDRAMYGGRNNFATRKEALRVSAARMIRQARGARRWKAYGVGALSEADCQRVIDWARAVVVRETAAPPVKPIPLHPLPQPKRRTGLPLFDLGID